LIWNVVDKGNFDEIRDDVNKATRYKAKAKAEPEHHRLAER